jgi:non-ribosomal peptide synthetase component F
MEFSRSQGSTRSSRSDAGGEAFDDSWIDCPIFARFEVIAERYPEKIALDDAVLCLTYRDVQQAAHHLAHRVEVAVPVGRAVGIYLPNSALFSIAALACLAAGRVFVPIDQNYPSERNDQIIKEAAPAAIIVDHSEGTTCPSMAAIHHLDIASSLNQKRNDKFLFRRQVDGPAVVLYTSGSTGRPKGICNDQRAILHRVIDFTKTCGLNVNDRFVLLSSPGTIAGIRDTFAALLNGASLYIADPYQLGMNGILCVLREHGITICYAVPALLRELLQLSMAKQAFNDLRIVRFGGDRILADDITLCRTVLPKSCRILIGFGLTEVPTIFQWFVPPDWKPDGPTVPCGYPSPDISVSLLAEGGATAARGEAAEVIVKSRYVALGTWQNGQLHSESIETDPDDPAARVIHTADMVRMRDDGLVELVGRKDR